MADLTRGVDSAGLEVCMFRYLGVFVQSNSPNDGTPKMTGGELERAHTMLHRSDSLNIQFLGLMGIHVAIVPVARCGD